jgi:hypothetical protein
LFEVFAGKKRVVASTAVDIFGSELRENWNWLKSQEYGKEVCDQIRSFGLNYVAGILKTAQEGGGEMALPELDAPGGGEEGLPELDAPGGGEEGLPELPALEEDAPDEGEEGEEEESPSEGIDNRLSEMEQL